MESIGKALRTDMLRFRPRQALGLQTGKQLALKLESYGSRVTAIAPPGKPYCRIKAIIAPNPTNTPPVTRLNAFATRRLLSVAPMRVPKPA